MHAFKNIFQASNSKHIFLKMQNNEFSEKLQENFHRIFILFEF